MPDTFNTLVAAAAAPASVATPSQPEKNMQGADRHALSCEATGEILLLLRARATESCRRLQAFGTPMIPSHEGMDGADFDRADFQRLPRTRSQPKRSSVRAFQLLHTAHSSCG